MSRKAHSEFPASRPWRLTIRSAVACAVAPMLAAACAADPPTSSQRHQSDIRAMNEFYSRLASDQTYYYPHVTIRVENGVARLSGYVWNTEALYHAKEVATNVPGITEVVDNLQLERGGLR
jgi:osmotically-inducible protein OsmY